MIAATNVQISANPPSKSDGLLNFRSENFVNRRFPPISHTSLLRDGGVDAVVVVTPTKTHFAVVTEATLSFLGLGSPPPTPTWGNMIAEGRQYIRDAAWITLIPGIALALTVLSLNLLGDGLRDVLDPRLRTD